MIVQYLDVRRVAMALFYSHTYAMLRRGGWKPGPMDTDFQKGINRCYALARAV